MSTAQNFITAADIAAIGLPVPDEIVRQEAEENWLRERNQFVGGSEAFELLNVKQYGRGCATALGYRKLGVEPDYPEQLDQEDQALLRRGNILEPIVAMLYEEQTGRKVRRPPLDKHGLPKAQHSKDHERAGVHTDRLILSGHGGVSETMDLEIKTRGEGPFLRVLRNGPFPGDILQPQWSMFVTGHKGAALATLGIFGGLPLKHFDVQRNDDLIDNHFTPLLDQFSAAVWGHGKPPAPVIDKDDERCKVCAFRMQCRGEELDRAEAQAMKAIRDGKTPLVHIQNANLAQALSERELMAQERKALDARLEEYDANILPLLKAEAGEGAGAFVSGFGKVYQLACRSNERVDAKRLKQEKPEVYGQFVVPASVTGEYYLRTYPVK